MSYLIVAQPGNHQHLFDQFYLAADRGQVEQFSYRDGKGVTHTYYWATQLSLNQEHAELKVNFLWHRIDAPGKEAVNDTWITDRAIDASNAPLLARAGRCRWRIEDSFNTLKNRGYQIKHNYGHGQRHLATIFQFLTMLALLVENIEQLACGLFQQVWNHNYSLTAVWESMLCKFKEFVLRSWGHLYELMVYGVRDVEPEAAKPT